MPFRDGAGKPKGGRKGGPLVTARLEERAADEYCGCGGTAKLLLLEFKMPPLPVVFLFLLAALAAASVGEISIVLSVTMMAARR